MVVISLTKMVEKTIYKCKISFIRFVTKYIFVTCLFDVINSGTFVYKFGFTRENSD
jgi:hypothetical protein